MVQQLGGWQSKVVHGIEKARGVLACCCLIFVQTLVVSCNHVSTTNVNNTSPAVNVSPSPQTQDSLKAKVEALENQPLGPSDLGVIGAFVSPNVTEIIAAGENAVPFLIEGLKQENKPALVGYAAYCLRQIKTDKGKEPAARAYKRLDKKRKKAQLDDEGKESFALHELMMYMRTVSEMSGDVPKPIKPH